MLRPPPCMLVMQNRSIQSSFLAFRLAGSIPCSEWKQGEASELKEREGSVPCSEWRQSEASELKEREGARLPIGSSNAEEVGCKAGPRCGAGARRGTRLGCRAGEGYRAGVHCRAGEGWKARAQCRAGEECGAGEGWARVRAEIQRVDGTSTGLAQRLGGRDGCDANLALEFQNAVSRRLLPLVSAGSCAIALHAVLLSPLCSTSATVCEEASHSRRVRTQALLQNKRLILDLIGKGIASDQHGLSDAEKRLIDGKCEKSTCPAEIGDHRDGESAEASQALVGLAIFITLTVLVAGELSPQAPKWASILTIALAALALISFVTEGVILIERHRVLQEFLNALVVTHQWTRGLVASLRQQGGIQTRQ
uniref:Uncharacterized protein n=1 Tax=Chromera velia CCMP2878 TaxID=1169474 RepID=A0A0G4FV32_9ALVE|eukprot:Cvel_18929.t1-p1 / transcript=Cvel_18929.t1 / gene=Cvel_18929 / organism=Chromera_velia_CCMP2878 / gene_product=hypothetical protein / transcript_product=hypothetical protein / location=Cvel_scaffold1597:10447-16386(+) / protein_length=365 / sequence_SO=supercontig / SO=protein_coding / is_pseudo=false